MEEAKGLLVGWVQGGPIGSGLFEQSECAVDIGADEGIGRDDGAIDVSFGGEVNDGAGTMLGQERADECGVADVAAHQQVTRIGRDRVQTGRIAGVGEGIEIDDGCAGGLKPGEDEVRADEAASSGDENRVAEGHRVFPW